MKAVWRKSWLSARITGRRVAKFNFSNPRRKSHFFLLCVCTFLFFVSSSRFSLRPYSFSLPLAVLSPRTSLFWNIESRGYILLASLTITPRQNCHRLRKYLSASASAGSGEREREAQAGVQCNRISADSESKSGKFTRSLSNHGRCRLPSRLPRYPATASTSYSPSHYAYLRKNRFY